MTKYTAEQKIFILEKINERKKVLFGSFNGSVSLSDKKRCWQEIYDAGASIGIPFPPKTSYQHIRDVFWPNQRRTTMVLILIANSRISKSDYTHLFKMNRRSETH